MTGKRSPKAGVGAMRPKYCTIFVFAMSWCLQTAHAADANSMLDESAAALLAVQLSSEIGDELRHDIMKQGISADDADALAFHIIEDVAGCSVRKFRVHKMPQIQTYLDLLIRNEEMASVLSSLAKTYNVSELNQMQSEIARVVQECLTSSREAVA
jgi:hypothetical protein